MDELRLKIKETIGELKGGAVKLVYSRTRIEGEALLSVDSIIELFEETITALTPPSKGL